MDVDTNEFPEYAKNALKTLNKIWSTFRGEHVAFSEDSMLPLVFRKNYTAWKLQTLTVDPRDNTQRMVHVLFIPQRTVMNTEIVTILITHAQENEYKHMVVVSASIPKTAKQNISKIQGDMIWEAVSYDELKVCTPANVLVPKYDIVPLQEHLQFNTEKMRKMSINDAMARVLGFRRGDILRITEVNINTGTNLSYRVVVAT